MVNSKSLGRQIRFRPYWTQAECSQIDRNPRLCRHLERPMYEKDSNLLAPAQANSPKAFDLRQVGAHPDYWYPLAWSDELRAGRGLGRRFAGQPVSIYRGKSGQGFSLGGR